MREVCICAAVVASNGTVIRCHRHSHGFMVLSLNGLKPGGELSQGFVTSHGRFVNRVEGLQLQRAAGIPSIAAGGYRGENLYSEDLY